jgi:hypothetical protein
VEGSLRGSYQQQMRLCVELGGCGFRHGGQRVWMMGGKLLGAIVRFGGFGCRVEMVVIWFQRVVAWICVVRFGVVVKLPRR